MTNCAYHRDAACKDCPRYAFVVKTPQIFQRTAAAPNDKHIALAPRVRQLNGANDLSGASSPRTAVG